MDACGVCGAWLRRGEQTCGRCGLPADAAGRFERSLAAPAERPSAATAAPPPPPADGEPAAPHPTAAHPTAPQPTAPRSTPWAAPRPAGTPPPPATSSPPTSTPAPSGRSWASPVAPGTTAVPPAPAPPGPWGPPPAPTPPVAQTAPTPTAPTPPAASPWTAPGRPASGQPPAPAPAAAPSPAPAPGPSAAPAPPGGAPASGQPATLPPPIAAGTSPPWSPPPGPPPGPGGEPPAGWSGPPRPPGQTGSGLRVAFVVTGAVVGSLVAIAFVCVLAVTLLGGNASDQFSAPDRPPWPATDQLVIGECIAPDIGDITPVTEEEMAPIPCTEPHRSEVFAEPAAGLDDAPYPGDDAVARQAEMFCYGAGFADYVGIDYDESTLGVSAHVPTEATWAEGLRHTTCFVHPPGNEPTTGSYRGSGL